MSPVRRFGILAGTLVAVAVAMIGLSAAPGGANPVVPTVPVTAPEQVQVAGIAVDPGDPGSGYSASATENTAVLNTMLAETGSSTGILVLSGVILLVIGGSMVGARRTHGA